MSSSVNFWERKPETDSCKVLEGVKVLDFSWMIAGPLVTAYLGAFGAHVIKVESHDYPDRTRDGPPFKDGIKGLDRSYRFCCSNGNKYGMALNMTKPEGLDIARKLVAWADVVTENYSPGIMKKWGLAYEDLIRVKPEVIMLSCSMQGQAGPRAHVAGLGNHITCGCGVAHLTGWPDRPPVMPIAGYSDVIAPLFGVVAIVAALNYRRRTGKGQYIDLSEFEAGVSMVAPALLDYSVNGREQNRCGNRSDWAVPHGAYLCKDGKWCVIGVLNDKERTNFCRVIGSPEWTRQPRFATFLEMKRNEDELDKLIAEWVIKHSAEEVMILMQNGGVSAGIVQTSQDLVDNDPQLRQQGIFQFLEHPEMGAVLQYGWPIQLSKSPWKLEVAPCLGEHTELICREILGLSDEEFVSLINADVLW